jgi:hypothetical protein
MLQKTVGGTAQSAKNDIQDIKNVIQQARLDAASARDVNIQQLGVLHSVQSDILSSVSSLQIIKHAIASNKSTLLQIVEAVERSTPLGEIPVQNLNSTAELNVHPRRLTDEERDPEISSNSSSTPVSPTEDWVQNL